MVSLAGYILRILPDFSFLSLFRVFATASRIAVAHEGRSVRCAILGWGVLRLRRIRLQLPTELRALHVLRPPIFEAGGNPVVSGKALDSRLPRKWRAEDNHEGHEEHEGRLGGCGGIPRSAWYGTPQPRAARRALATLLGQPSDPKQSAKTRKSESAKGRDRSYQ